MLYLPSNIQVEDHNIEDKEMIENKQKNAESYMEEQRKMNLNYIKQSDAQNVTIKEGFKDSALVKKELNTDQQAQFILDNLSCCQGYWFVENEYDSTKVIVSKLPADLSDTQLLNELRRFGEVTSLSIIHVLTTEDQLVGYGFIQFNSKEEAKKALDAKKIALKRTHQDIHKGMPVIKPQTNKYYNKIPESPFLRQTIDQIAKYVAKHGIIFEYLLLKREKENPTFRFIYDKNIEAYHYYRWKIISCLNNEDSIHYRRIPYNLTIGSTIYYPPELYEQPM